jgi:hypothetical protein
MTGYNKIFCCQIPCLASGSVKNILQTYHLLPEFSVPTTLSKSSTPLLLSSSVVRPNFFHSSGISPPFLVAFVS